MSPTKQAKSQGNGVKEPKLHQVTEWRKKKLWENPGSVGGQFSSGQQWLQEQWLQNKFDQNIKRICPCLL